MRYLLAFIMPPAAVLSCKDGIPAMINFGLWLAAWPMIFFGLGFILYLISAIHACLIVQEFYTARRAQELQAAIRAALTNKTEAAAPAKPPPKGYDPERDVWKIEA